MLPSLCEYQPLRPRTVTGAASYERLSCGCCGAHAIVSDPVAASWAALNRTHVCTLVMCESPARIGATPGPPYALASVKPAGRYDGATYSRSLLTRGRGCTDIL